MKLFDKKWTIQHSIMVLLLVICGNGFALETTEDLNGADFALNTTDDLKGFSCNKPSCHKPCKPFCNKPCCKPCKPNCTKPCCKPNFFKPCSDKPCSQGNCGCGTAACCSKNIVCLKTIPTTITTAGVYCLASNLAVPCDNILPLITVAISDVMINLGGNVLSGGQRGVVVNQNLDNVIVANGTISDTDAEAILVMAGCSSVQLFDLQVINCNQSKCSQVGVASVSFSGLLNNRITQTAIKNIAITDSLGIGLNLLYNDNAVVANVNVLNLLSANATALDSVGFYVSGNSNTLLSCNAANIASNLTGLNAYGYFIDSCTSTVIKDCRASQVSSIAPAENSFGFLISFSSNTVLYKCLSNDNSAVGSGALPITATSAVGFRSENSVDTSMFGCSAAGNNSTLANIAHGFVLQTDTLSNMNECISQANSGDGFRVFSDCTNCITRFCTSLGNLAFGFNLTPAANATDIFYTNFAARNGNPVGSMNYSPTIPFVRSLGACFLPAVCPPFAAAGTGDNIDGDITI